MIEYSVPRDWLSKKLVGRLSDEPDAEHRSRLIAEIEVGMCNLRDDWVRVFGVIQEDDEIWEFESPGDYWACLCGRAGIALVSPSGPISGITLEMN